MTRIIILIALFLFWPLEIYADTVYLKNGQNLEGLICHEGKETVDLDVGCGLVVFRCDEIERIYRSTPDETAQIKKNWTANRAQAQKTKTLTREDLERVSEKWAGIVSQIEDQRLDDEQKRQMDANAKVVPVTLDKHRHLMVEAVINGKTRAFLVVDTGAPEVTLTANIARQMGIDVSGLKCIGESMVLNGKHKVGRVTLDSIKLADFEEKNIEAQILLEDDKEIESAFRDGLLGLTFLNRFNISLNPKNGTLIFKKIPLPVPEKKKERKRSQ